MRSVVTQHGPTQERLLSRGSAGIIMTMNDAERMAARRLVQRGVLVRARVGGPGIGYTTLYRVVKP